MFAEQNGEPTKRMLVWCKPIQKDQKDDWWLECMRWIYPDRVSGPQTADTSSESNVTAIMWNLWDEVLARNSQQGGFSP